MTIKVFNSSLDGHVYHDGSDTGNTSWAALTAGGGTAFDEGRIDIHIACYAISPVRYDRCHRGILLFDTSSLTVNADITAATLSLYGYDKNDGAGTSPNLNIYSSAPASNTVLAAGDYDSLGSTPFSTAISYADFSTAGYNDFVLNASGLAVINKTGISKFGCRNANYDAAGVDPGYTTVASSNMRMYASGDPALKAKLTVTYTVTPPPPPKLFYF